MLRVRILQFTRELIPDHRIHSGWMHLSNRFEPRRQLIHIQQRVTACKAGFFHRELGRP